MIFFGKGNRRGHAGEDVIAGADTLKMSFSNKKASMARYVTKKMYNLQSCEFHPTLIN